MKLFKSGLLVMLMFFVVCGIALPATKLPNGSQKPDSYSQVNCREKCEKNMTLDADCQCICNVGFYQETADSDCVEYKCAPKCDNGTQYCNGSECICKDGYRNDGVAGAPLCVEQKEGTTTSHNEEIADSHSTTTTLSPTTQSTTTTKLPPTHTTTTTTTAKPSTTTLKPSPKPTPKPHKSGMSPWAITGIIILVACLAGLGGFVIYRQRSRGSYRAAGR